MPARTAARYAELHSWSNFTFLEGASHPEDLARRAAALELTALALTDRDGLYGTVRFTKAAGPLRLGAICGAELTLDDGRTRKRAPAPHELIDVPRIVLLVENERGYANLVRVVSHAQMRGKKRDARLRFEDFSEGCDGLIALSGGRHGLIERSLRSGDIAAAERDARAIAELFPAAFYLELQHHLHPEDERIIAHMDALARRLGLPCVATNGVAYAAREDAQLADILACVKYKTNLDEAGTLLRPNSEYYLKSAAQMARLFAPHLQALRNTLVIAERCAFRLDKRGGQFPLFPLPPDEASAHTYLRTLTLAGAARRYPAGLPSKVERQIEYELGIIARMDLAGYFLVVWDIVRAANELGVLCQGRGSAANSAVCYVLGITAVDPVAHDLLFERFLSEERHEVPDIDIDFAHQDREKVIQYVYERYGREHAAMTAEVITYRTCSAIRDVGKAIGLTLAQVDEAVREYDASGSHETAPVAPATNAIGERLVHFCRKIEGFPRHLGIHSGGMVITRNRLIGVAPVEWASMHDRSVVQWDKDDLADLGLIKIDLLGLGMLSLLRETFTLFERRYRREIAQGAKAPLALHTIPPDDAPTYEMLQRADSIGVFQVESRAQQSMLPRMKPRCFYDLVMQVAIIRPGPIQGDMVHPFLRRRSGLEPVTYPHPRLKPILERTLGVPLFQEQGMRIAIEAAGFSPGQADRLRRAMGHKRSRERMAEIYPKLVGGMVDNGIEREAADQLFHMLQGFADYGFPESHAASFALLAYASAYVKCHEPALFCAAILNVQPMGFYSTEVLVNDARRHDAAIKPVEANASEFWSFVDGEGAVRLGFHVVRGLGEAQRAQLLAALADGPFDGLADFARRTKLSKEALENMAAAGAFAPWYASRRDAIWALRGLDEREARGELGRAMEVDGEPAGAFAPLTAREETAFDLWGTGITRIQLVAHVRDQLDAQRVIRAALLTEQPNHLVCKIGGLVITRQRPGTAKGFVFLTLEDETGLVNVIVNPRVYERYRRVVRQASGLIIEGTLQKDHGSVDVLAKRFWPLELGAAGKVIHARNFH